jgi:hypothetical protein
MNYIVSVCSLVSTELLRTFLPEPTLVYFRHINLPCYTHDILVHHFSINFYSLLHISSAQSIRPCNNTKIRIKKKNWRQEKIRHTALCSVSPNCTAQGTQSNALSWGQQVWPSDHGFLLQIFYTSFHHPCSYPWQHIYKSLKSKSDLGKHLDICVKFSCKKLPNS